MCQWGIVATMRNDEKPTNQAGTNETSRKSRRFGGVLVPHFLQLSSAIAEELLQISAAVAEERERWEEQARETVAHIRPLGQRMSAHAKSKRARKRESPRVTTTPLTRDPGQCSARAVSSDGSGEEAPRTGSETPPAHPSAPGPTGCR